MITNTQIRNALTGALAFMVLGLMVSCADSLVAPADEALSVDPQLEVLIQDPTPACSLDGGIWVCPSGGPEVTTSDDDDGPIHCEVIEGVMYCEPVGGD